MDNQDKEPKSACRLPEGIEIKDLCAMKGIWPKRELSQEELLETYKTYYSYVLRREAMLLLNLFLKKYGQNAREAIEEFYYELGKEDGATEKQAFGSLLNVVANYSVRPYCYQIHHYQTGPDKMAYKVLRCPFADLLKEMKLEEMGTSICPPFHKGFSEVFGFKFNMPKFLLAGADCCEQIWEKSDQDITEP